jgi:hypothetical protein
VCVGVGVGVGAKYSVFVRVSFLVQAGMQQGNLLAGGIPQ